MKVKKNQLTMSVFENRVLSGVGQNSTSGGSGTVSNPYTLYEFIDLLMKNLWKGGYVCGMGYVSSNFIQSSEGLSSDYGSVYDGSNITRFVRGSSFDFEKHFASMFSFMGGNLLNSSFSASSFYSSIYSSSSPSSSSPSSSESDNGGSNDGRIELKKKYIPIKATPISLEVDVIDYDSAFYIAVYISCAKRFTQRVKVQTFLCKYDNSDVEMTLYNVRQLNVCKNKLIANFAIANNGEDFPKLCLEVFINDNKVTREERIL